MCTEPLWGFCRKYFPPLACYPRLFVYFERPVQIVLASGCISLSSSTVACDSASPRSRILILAVRRRLACEPILLRARVFIPVYRMDQKMDDFDVTKIVIEMVIFYSRRRLQLVLFPFVEVDYSIIDRFSCYSRYFAELVGIYEWIAGRKDSFFLYIGERVLF